MPEGPGRGGQGAETLNSEVGAQGRQQLMHVGEPGLGGGPGEGTQPRLPAVVTGSGLPGTRGPKYSREDWGRQGGVGGRAHMRSH